MFHVKFCYFSNVHFSKVEILLWNVSCQYNETGIAQVILIALLISLKSFLIVISPLYFKKYMLMVKSIFLHSKFLCSFPIAVYLCVWNDFIFILWMTACLSLLSPPSITAFFNNFPLCSCLFFPFSSISLCHWQAVALA